MDPFYLHLLPKSIVQTESPLKKMISVELSCPYKYTLVVYCFKAKVMCIKYIRKFDLQIRHYAALILVSILI